MYITNLEESVHTLKGRLLDYLSLRLEKKLNYKSRFPCFLHDGDGDNMGFDPKANYERVHCFTHNCSADIFTAASHFDGLPSSGPEWVTETIPALCELLEIKLSMGEPSSMDLEKARQYRLANEITDILSLVGDESGYAHERNWQQDKIVLGSMPEEKLIRELLNRGWDNREIVTSPLIHTAAHSYFGKDKLTLAIKDERSRTVGFIYRNLTDRGPKYVNTPDTLIYQKGKVLMGLDTALVEARRSGIYIVEGPGDLIQLKRLGILNAAATCGTAFTVDHALHLKALGIKSIYFALDWDEAGTVATDRIFFNVLNQVQGISAHVIEPPAQKVKDIDELLKDQKTPEIFLALKKTGAFEWALARLSENLATDAVCEKMIPLVAAEPTAIRRELLIKQLSEHTGLSFHSVLRDVENIRNGKFEERKSRLLAAAQQYVRQVEEDPDNLISIIAVHEQQVANIEKEFSREVIGAGYQMQRYEAIQTIRQEEEAGSCGFKMNWFKEFEVALSDGMPWHSGALMYAGGRANSGKTATCIMIGTDIANTDEDSIVLYHFTDDSYLQTEPRIKAGLARMMYPEITLPIGAIVRPHVSMRHLSENHTKALHATNERMKYLLSNERLAIIDSEDGSNLSTLEKNIRYYRQKYPSKKIFVVVDSTYNYRDFYNLDQTQRMTQISNVQKELTTKYQCTMLATAEYRKNLPRDTTKLVLPVDDDLADARALMYRPNLIFHVYNDLHDRKEAAEIFWKGEDGTLNPRLMLCITKNKISSFKNKLILDLDPKTVTLKPQDLDTAREDADEYWDAKENGNVQITRDSNGTIHVETEWDEE